MWDLLYGLVRTQVLHVFAVLGIADLLADQPLDVGALVAASGCDAPSLGRLLRAGVAAGLLSVEDGSTADERRYALTPIGQMLRRDTQAPRNDPHR